MLYPQNYEQKVGFNEIRSLLLGHCLSPLGRDRVGQISFLTDAGQIRLLQSQVHELRTILSELRDKPQQDFFDLRPAIQRIRIEGTHLEEQEIWDLYRPLCTLHAWVEIIRSEACNGLTASVLIAKFPGSRGHFERRFREAMGHSVLDEILLVRLQRAGELLAGTDMPISAIADFCGFRTHIALHKFFRSRTGMTMGAWRKKHRIRS